MTDGNFRQRKFYPCPVMDHFTFSEPAFFKIAFDLLQIGDSFLTWGENSGRVNDPVDGIAVVFIITGKVKYTVCFQNPVQLGGEVAAQQAVAPVTVFGPGVWT